MERINYLERTIENMNLRVKDLEVVIAKIGADYGPPEDKSVTLNQDLEQLDSL